MKEEKQNRKPIVIVLLLFVGIILIGLTAAAVYAGRFMTREVSSLLSQFTTITTEPLALGIERQEDGSIFEQGVLVTGVSPSSPAQQAGIRRGTIILEIDGQEVNNLAQLTELLASSGSGSTIAMTILNSSKPETVSATLAESPPLLGVQIAEANIGLNFGRFPEYFDPSDIPEDFHFDPDNLPFRPGDLGLPEDLDFEHGAMASGVMVADVVAGSAAEEAGLLVGDVLDAIDGQTISSVDQLLEKIGATNPGDAFTFSINRDGATMEVTTILGAHPDDASRGFLGIQPAPTMPSLGKRGSHGNFDPLGIPFQGEFPTGGAVIVAVVDDSPAANAGLQEGDIIKAVNDAPITNVDELIQIVSSKKPGDTITLSLLRDDQELQVEAALAANPEDAAKAYLGVHLGAFYNVDLEKFGEGGSILPEEFFYRLHPDYEPGKHFEFPEDFEVPESLEELLPDFAPGNAPHDLQKQDA